MAVSPIAAGASPQTNPFAQFRQAFSQLSGALQSGNLTAAQSAYNTLASSPLAQNGPFAQGLQQIGQDLQSGDVADAQKALASLQQQAQQARGHHHHHHGGVKAPDQADPSGQSSSTNQTNSSDPNGDGDNDASSIGTVTAAAANADHSVDITA